MLVAFLRVKAEGYYRSCDLRNNFVESVFDLKKLGINRGFCSIIASVLDVVVVFVIESVVSAECCVF